MQIPPPHVPPRRQAPPHYSVEVNPEDAPSSTAQLRAVPWVTLIATTAATTLTGYALLEGAKAFHAWVKRRRAAQADSEEQVSEARQAGRVAAARAVEEARNPQRPAGMQRDGTFQLPEPDGPPMRQPPAYGGFARPPHWQRQRAAQPAQPHLRVVPQPQHAGPSVEQRLQAVEAFLAQQQAMDGGEVG